MKNIFFIIGTPRTRSTWLANLFTYQDTFCYHEALRYCTSVSEFKKLLLSHDEPNVGNADSDLIPVMDEMVRAFPNAKILIVEREIEDAVRSFLTLVQGHSRDQAYKFFKAYNERLGQIKERYKYRTVSYYDLNKIEIVRQMWAYILPDIPFNNRRFKILDEMSVNVVIKKMMLNSKPGSLAGRLRNKYLNL